MTSPGRWALVRVGCGALALLAIAAQAVQLPRAGSRPLIDYVDYYSLASAVLGLIVLLIAAARFRAPPSGRFDLLRGGTVVCLALTGLIHSLHLVDVRVLLLPVLFLVDWLIDPPATRLPFRVSLAWLVLPALWATYTMVHGLLTGWYPYTFLDPANGGQGRALAYFTSLALGLVLLGTGVVALGNLAGGLRRRAAPWPARRRQVADLTENSWRGRA